MREAQGSRGFTPYITGIFLFLGLFGCLWSVLGFSELEVNPVAPLLTGAAYAAACCGLNGRWKFAYIAAAAAPIALTVAAAQPVSNGLNITINQSFLTLERYLGRIMPRYDVAAELSQVLCVTLVFVLIAVLLGALCGRTVCGGTGWRVIYGFVLFSIWAAALLFRAPLPTTCILPLIAALAVLAGKTKAVAHPWILAVVITLALLSAIPQLIAGNRRADAARLSLARTIRNARYSGDDRSLPEGDFSKLGESVPGLGFEQLFSDGSERYLRGFVGERYTGDGWAELSPDNLAEYATLFSWLHSRGFYAQHQNTLLVGALGISVNYFEITVDNAQSNARYIFSAYDSPPASPDSIRIGDANLLAKGLRGQRQYSISVSDNRMSDYDSLYARLVSEYRSGETKAADYLKSENAYREFVYDNYLSVPETATATIKKLLGGLDLPSGGLSLADAKLVVNAYLGTLAYVDNPEMTYDSGDFLTFFLEASREGNSVHFATAATLLFRYLGIPARYVEGHVLQDDFDGEAVFSLNGENSRAWTEIYRDGVGFVPFEMLPPDIPPQINETLEQPRSETPPEEGPQTPVQVVLTVLLWFLLVLILLLTLCFLCLAVRRAIKRLAYKKLMSTSSNNEAVSRMTSLLIRALSHVDISYKNGSLFELRLSISDKFDAALGNRYMEVITVHEKALFSGCDVRDNERDMVTEFYDDVVLHIKTNAGLYDKFRLSSFVCLI